MAIQRYGDHNWRLLLGRNTGCLPRRTVYGSPAAIDCGLQPVGDYADLLLDPSDYKEAIETMHAEKAFAMHHEEEAGLSKGWSQNGLNFCWAYGVTMALMTCRAAERKPPVLLAPESLGWLTGWRNTGYYCDAAIKGARERGVASSEYVPQHSLRKNSYKDGWEEDALRYRAMEWWDTRYASEESMVQQCVSLLCTGRALSIAYNWWSHAVCCVGVRWSESERNNLIWVIRNSHGENDWIELTGRRGVPDEAYCLRAASFAD